jgi:hypothetical protein
MKPNATDSHLPLDLLQHEWLLINGRVVPMGGFDFMTEDHNLRRLFSHVLGIQSDRFFRTGQQCAGGTTLSAPGLRKLLRRSR